MIVPLTRRGGLAVVAWLAAGPALAQLPILPDAGQLRPGQFAWQPETAPSGPLLVLVSLTEQVARVYRNGIEIGISSVSSGRAGHATPTGVFTILQKARVHHSSTYDEASMPYTRAPHLGWRRAACGRRAGLPQQSWLRPPPAGFRRVAVRRHAGGDHGGHRRGS